VYASIGLDLGAETRGEIALSIMAEILAVRRKATTSMNAIARRA
jgi:xanthine/CO dehydrogenase XdhC/CoxF family maturation factor